MAGGTAVLAAPAAAKAASSAPGWLGSAITAGGSILGGLFSGSSANKLWKKQYRASKEFAQQGIRWKVADARAAGISPLVALGAQTHSPTLSATGSSLGDGIAAAAGEIGRHVSGRENAKMQRVRAAKENALLAAQLEESRARTRSHNADASLAEQQAFNSSVARMAQALVSSPSGNMGTGSPVGTKFPSSLPGNPDVTKERSDMATPTRGYGMLWGHKIYTPPGTSPLGFWEEEGGEPMSWGMSPAYLADLIQYNAMIRLRDRLHGARKLQTGKWKPKKKRPSKDAWKNKWKWENPYGLPR